MKKRKSYLLLGIGLGLTIAIELILRLGFGLGNPVLSQQDSYTGYRFRPNQTVTRFGNYLSYNQYSQRSPPLNPIKPPHRLRILMIGDSVLNGGVLMDQKEIVTEVLAKKIRETGQQVEVLNASAGSWGIGNQLGYLREFGIFDSDVLVLQIGTHDLSQPTSTGERVGIDPNYPDRPPLFALQEVFQRYLWPAIALRFQFPLPYQEIPVTRSPKEQFQANLETLATIINLAKTKHLHLFVLYTPNYYDLTPQAPPPPYKVEFVTFLQSLGISRIDAQEAWAPLPPSLIASYYRDSVHLAANGHKALAELLFQHLCYKHKVCISVKGQ